MHRRYCLVYLNLIIKPLPLCRLRCVKAHLLFARSRRRCKKLADDGRGVTRRLLSPDPRRFPDAHRGNYMKFYAPRKTNKIIIKNIFLRGERLFIRPSRFHVRVRRDYIIHARASSGPLRGGNSCQSRVYFYTATCAKPNAERRINAYIPYRSAGGNKERNAPKRNTKRVRLASAERRHKSSPFVHINAHEHRDIHTLGAKHPVWTEKSLWIE